MDRFAAWATGEVDNDLMLLHDQGMAYQIDQSQLVAYDETYFDKCAGYDGQVIGEKLNAGRIALVDRHYGRGPLVDIGIGSGEFIRKRPYTYGVDVNQTAKNWLVKKGLWAGRLTAFRAFTMWDVVEHLPDPNEYFSKICDGSYLFASIPVFKSLRSIRLSKHYRPGEHLLYFTSDGFTRWMGLYGFKLLETTDFETQAGRESILSFAFQRVPG